MRMTLHPAAQARAELPSTYCEREDPSRPCTSSTVRHWLGICLPMAMAKHIACAARTDIGLRLLLAVRRPLSRKTCFPRG